MAAASDGTLFVGSNLSRVHVFSHEGRPLRGFVVPVAEFELRVAGADRLIVKPRDGSSALTYDFDGAMLETTDVPDVNDTPADDVLRIDAGNVVRMESGRPRLLIRGYATHARMLLHTLAVGLLLFAGGFLLIAGVVWTGRRAPR